MVNSKEKGKRGEREFRDLLIQHGFEARRGQQFSGSPDSPDVKCNDNVCHWEVKYGGKINLYDAIEQAISDKPEDKKPVVAYRQVKREGAKKDWVAILKMNDFLDLIKMVSDYKKMIGL